MAFTRFHDGPYRIKKQLEESTFTGRYMLDTPGPGINMPFYEETQMRLQKWGANLAHDPVTLENDLIGLTRPLNRDLLTVNDYKMSAPKYIPNHYSSKTPFVEESRATDPAWTYREKDQMRWENPWLNPQANLEPQFQMNIQTRILEKDYYVPVTKPHC